MTVNVLSVILWNCEDSEVMESVQVKKILWR